MIFSSVDALTQFRFKEEQEWQRDLDEAGPDPSQLLSIDCVALAKALSCIPLHKRLGIEESVFEVNVVCLPHPMNICIVQYPCLNTCIQL